MKAEYEAWRTNFGTMAIGASWAPHLAFPSPEATGDFNRDGNVDAADYIVWRKGISVAPSQDNYNIWRAHFGQTAGGSDASVNTAVPEQATVVMFTITVAGVWTRWRWRTWRVSILNNA